MAMPVKYTFRVVPGTLRIELRSSNGSFYLLRARWLNHYLYFIVMAPEQDWKRVIQELGDTGEASVWRV